MKWVLFFWISLPTIVCAQIHASKIAIFANGFTVGNSYTTIQPPEPPYSQTKTVVAQYSLYTDSDIVVKGTSITLNLSGRSLYNGVGPSYIDWSDNLVIELDTLSRKIKTLSADYSGKWYYDYPPDNYYFWSDSKKNLSLENIPYHVSLSKDSIIAFLDTSDLRTASFSINDYDLDQTRFTYTILDSTDLLEIGKDAFIKVVIIGNFRLSVIPKSASKHLIIDLNSKSLKLSSRSINYNQPIPCFDLLGRKHDLEFLGSDNTSATYSVRSLRRGVYFVNNGRETVKFLITK
ncbi:MAG: hypothetical protein ACHQM6_00225 [Candidatus Kapaibacterium sp.]